MNRSVRVRALSAAYCLLILCCLSACAIGGRNRGEADKSFADDNQVSESGHDKADEATGTESGAESPVSDGLPEPEEATAAEPEPEEATAAESEPEEATAAESESVGTLSSVEDIGLHAVDESGQNYAFSYNQEEFSAQYTKDNWKIMDSYKITNANDMIIICQALSDAHAVHGRDMESFRTPEDMAFEWFQHNLAYEFLPDDSPWKRSAKDVDLNPADQGKTFREMYEDRTGKKLRVEDLLRLD